MNRPAPSWHAEIDALPDYLLRSPCRFCGEPSRGRGPKSTKGQDVVYCASCRRAVYNAPRAETGKPQRSVNSRPDLKPGQRQRILERDNNTCQKCGRTPARHGVVLHVAHVLSVKEGREVCCPNCGYHLATDEDLYLDRNLFACCEECNLDTGSNSLAPVEWLRLIYANLERAK